MSTRKQELPECAARIYGVGNDLPEERLRSFLPHAILAPTFMSGRNGIHHPRPSLRRRFAATQRGTGDKDVGGFASPC